MTTTNEIAWSKYPEDCWLVFDDDAWQTNATLGITPPNPWLVDHGATVMTAPTLAELATQSGIAAAQLLATVDDIATGRAQPPRTGTVKLSQPPYRAVPLIAGVTFTMGGLRVDQSAQLLDSNGAAIGGLYAAGGTMGGLHGGPRVGYADLAYYLPLLHHCWHCCMMRPSDHVGCLLRYRRSHPGRSHLVCMAESWCR